MFIDMARKFLDPGSIFQIEVGAPRQEKLDQLLMSLINDFRLKRLPIKSTGHKRT